MNEQGTSHRYGPYSLVAAVITIILLEVPIWMMAPVPIGILVLGGPLLIGLLLIASMLIFCGGRTAQIGRGMLVGSIAAPLSIAIFGGAVYLAQVAGAL